VSDSTAAMTSGARSRRARARPGSRRRPRPRRRPRQDRARSPAPRASGAAGCRGCTGSRAGPGSTCTTRVRSRPALPGDGDGDDRELRRPRPRPAHRGRARPVRLVAAEAVVHRLHRAARGRRAPARRRAHRRGPGADVARAARGRHGGGRRRLPRRPRGRQRDRARRPPGGGGLELLHLLLPRQLGAGHRHRRALRARACGLRDRHAMPGNCPPSTTRQWPTTQLARSESRKAMQSATSSGVP
jgi:hypothetical protein